MSTKTLESQINKPNDPVVPTQTVVQQPVVQQQLVPQQTQVAQAVSGLNSYVNTPVANSMNYPKLAATVVGTYVVLEVINHAILGAYVMPYLASLGWGATAMGAVFYGGLAVCALGLSWVVYKLFFKQKVKTVNPNIQYVPVTQ